MTVEHSISDQMSVLHSHWYGCPPSAVKTHVTADVVVCVLEETFTKAERKLVERNQHGGIKEIRRRFQEVMADEFISIVEQETGRRVRSFVSDSDLQENISIEVFLLGDLREDMSGFE